MEDQRSQRIWNRPPGRDELLRKLQRYCAYQDRCHYEVRNRLKEYGAAPAVRDEIMAQLIGDGFLDEERFARSYARGKFQQKAWGRMKIVGELKRRGLNDYLIQRALEEIDEQEYQVRLEEVLRKRMEQKELAPNSYEQRIDLLSFARRRGYEMELINLALKDLSEGGK